MFPPTWRAMQSFTDLRDANTPDEAWFLEHAPVFTQGLNGWWSRSAPRGQAAALRELATLLRDNRSLQYNYGSTGPGSAMHVLGEAFKRDAKVEMVHIPFKGAAPLTGE